jgi:phosphoglycolate phosphatase-like HAD superfamily hydrolase
MPLDIPRIRALCFDIDGTLSDTDDVFVQRLAHWLGFTGFLLPHKDARLFARRLVMLTENPGSFLYGLPDRLGFDDGLAAVGDWLYRLGLGKNTRPFLLMPGVREMLSYLAERYPLAVVSARGVRSTRRFLEQFELTTFFQCVVTGQTCRHTKPYPDPILYAARQLGIPPQACLMVGDTSVDILAGKAAGAQVVGVLCGFGEETELRRLGADLILADTFMLLQALSNQPPSSQVLNINSPTDGGT